MRRALATFCCVVVGLQVFAFCSLLAGGVLVYFSQLGGPVAVALPAASDHPPGYLQPTGTPYPLPASPYPTYAVPEPQFSPLAPPPLPVATFQTAPSEPVPPPAEPPVSADVTAQDRHQFDGILATRDKHGSPLAGTLLAGAEADREADEQVLIETFKQLAAEEPAVAVAVTTLPAPPSPEPDVREPSDPCSAPQELGQYILPGSAAPVAAAGHDSSLETLHAAVQELYSRADRHEHESGNWQRADELRRLARCLRRVAVEVANEGRPLGLISAPPRDPYAIFPSGAEVPAAAACDGPY
jgi:hypothetical protein